MLFYTLKCMYCIRCILSVSLYSLKCFPCIDLYAVYSSALYSMQCTGRFNKNYRIGFCLHQYLTSELLSLGYSKFLRLHTKIRGVLCGVDTRLLNFQSLRVAKIRFKSFLLKRPVFLFISRMNKVFKLSKSKLIK